MAIVYIHRRKDIQDPFLNVFYVGIGKSEKRSIRKDARSVFWNNIVNKYGYDIEITHENILWEEACSIEKYLISFYGRHDLNLGNLCNHTDGGEGIINLSELTRKKMSDSRTGEKNHMYGRTGAKHPGYGKKASDEARKKISIAFTGEKHHAYGKKGYFTGKTHTDEVRKKISDSKIGKKMKNPKACASYGFLGKKHSEQGKINMSIAQKKRYKKKYEDNLFNASQLNRGDASICAEKNTSNI
jgi:hypothetical protein